MAIAFSSAVSANLSILKSTNEQFQISQKRVATGKMIFSASDDAARYRMSETMLGRARQIDDVNNNIGLALKTLTSVDNALKNISDLVTAAQAIARKAQSEGADGVRGVTSTANIAATTTVAGTAAAETFSITSDSGQSFNYTFQNATTTWGTVVDALNAANIGVQAEFIPSATAGQTNIRFKSTNGKDFTFNGTSDTGAMASLTGFTSPTGQTFTAANLFRNGTTAPTATQTGFTIGFGGSVVSTAAATLATNTVIAANSTLVFTDGNGQTRTLAYTAASTLNQVMIDINGLNAGVKAELVNQTGAAINQLRIRNTNGGNISIQAGTGAFITGGTVPLVAAGGTATGYAASLSSNNALRLTYGQQYDSIINNINQVITNVPVTTGRNLLAGNNMAVVMDEFGGNSLTINGVNLTGVGNTNTALGFTGALGGNTWVSDAAIQASAAASNAALNSLRNTQATFSTFTSYMKDRYDINASSKSELSTLGNELVAADVAEESANLTALQTQQQFAVQAFSMGSQTQQALLRLLG